VWTADLASLPEWALAAIIRPGGIAMDSLANIGQHISDLEGKFSFIERETDQENAVLWDAVRELRRAVNRLEQLQGVQAQTQWLVQSGSPRHPDSGPELGV
jgi:hypothetical protein